MSLDILRETLDEYAKVLKSSGHETSSVKVFMLVEGAAYEVSHHLGRVDLDGRAYITLSLARVEAE